MPKIATGQASLDHHGRRGWMMGTGGVYRSVVRAGNGWACVPCCPVTRRFGGVISGLVVLQ